MSKKVLSIIFTLALLTVLSSSLFVMAEPVTGIFVDPDAEWAFEYSGTKVSAGIDKSVGLEISGEGLPIDSDNKYQDKPSIRYNISSTEYGWWFTGYAITLNLEAYSECNFEAKVKGAVGGEKFSIGFTASGHNVTMPAEATKSDEWTTIKFAVDDLMAKKADADFTNVTSFVLTNAVTNTPTKFWVTDIKITEEAPAPTNGIYYDKEAAWSLQYDGTKANAGIDKNTGFDLENGATPLDDTNKYQDKPSIRYDISSTSFGWWFSGYDTILDLTAYADYTLEAKVKGAVGGEKFKLGFKALQKADNSKDANVGIDVTAGAAGEWTTVKIPVSDLIAKDAELDYTKTIQLVAFFATNSPVKFWMSDIKMVKNTDNPKQPTDPKPTEKGALWTLNYDSETLESAGTLASDKDVLEKWAKNGLFPLDDAQKYNGKPAMRLNVSDANGWWIAMIHEKIDVTKYKGKILQVAVKGEKGGEKFRLGFKKASSNAAALIEATTDWKVINIKIDDLIKDFPEFDFSGADGFVVHNENGEAFKAWFADVKIVEPTSENNKTGEKFPIAFAVVFGCAALVLLATALVKKREN